MARRGSRYTWFPINPTFFGESTEAYTWYNTELSVGGAAVPGFGTGVLAIPLLQDADQGAEEGSEAEGTSLRDRVEGKDYAVERVVGKVWGAVSQTTAGEAGESVAAQVILAVGLAVLPVNDSNDQPALNVDDYDPLRAGNAGAPWMWRRTWVLYNNLASPLPILTGPTNIGSYGSMIDGGHMDAKSVRRVTREQRLFIVASGYALSIFENGGSSTVPLDSVVQFGYDLRVLGAMRKARNHSTFK